MSRPYACRSCGREHDNYHSQVAHGLCSECRDSELNRARVSLRCCRCGAGMMVFTPAEGKRSLARFLVCGVCGLVVTRDPDDKVQSVEERSLSGWAE